MRRMHCGLLACSLEFSFCSTGGSGSCSPSQSAGCRLPGRKMGFYSRVIFPRICNFVLDTPPVAEQRRKLLEGAGGEILEIGFGTGLNLAHYPRSVRKITAVDPNVGMHRLAERRIKQTAMEVDQRQLSG